MDFLRGELFGQGRQRVHFALFVVQVLVLDLARLEPLEELVVSELGPDEVGVLLN